MWFNLGKIIGLALPNLKNWVLFFIPHMGAGGAEQVHLQLLDILGKKYSGISIVATNSQEVDLKDEFEKNSKVFSLSKWMQWKPIFFGCLGVFTSLINRSEEKILLIGSHSYFFYRLLPFLDESKFYAIDIIHNLEVGGIMRYGSLFNDVSSKIHEVIAVDTITAHLITRKSNRKSVIVVTNPTNEVFFQSFRVRSECSPSLVFVGRYDPVKRPHIVESLAKRNPELNIGWVGNVQDANQKKGITYHGLIKDREGMALVMNHYDILVLTSSTEAFPMVIQEAMALGMIVVSTNVGGISTHVKHQENGILIQASEDEAVLNEIERQVNQLVADNSLSAKISTNAHKYAREHFSAERYAHSMMELLP